MGKIIDWLTTLAWETIKVFGKIIGCIIIVLFISQTFNIDLPLVLIGLIVLIRVYFFHRSSQKGSAWAQAKIDKWNAGREAKKVNTAGKPVDSEQLEAMEM